MAMASPSTELLVKKKRQSSMPDIGSKSVMMNQYKMDSHWLKKTLLPESIRHTIPSKIVSPPKMPNKNHFKKYDKFVSNQQYSSEKLNID